MQYSIKKLPDSKVEFTVSLDKDELISYVNKTENQLAGEIQIEGFRPGKAPKEIIRKKIGEAKIREEALGLAIQSSLSEALAKESLDVIDQSDLKVNENTPDGLTYQAVFYVFPEMELGEYKGLTIKKNNIEVSENEVKNVLDEVLKSRAVLKPAERPAQIGDRVEIDFNIKDHGTVIKGGNSQNHPLVLGEEKFVPGFEAQIIGMKTGETKNFSIKIPVDYYQKTIAGKDLDFEVTLKKVEDMAVPKLDDEFAKSLGHANSLSELEVSVKQGLMAEKQEKEKDRIRGEILEKIASKIKVDVPAILIEKRLDSMVDGLDQELHRGGMELGLYLAQIKKTQDELRRDWRAQAEKQVKTSLVARAIAKAEKLKVSDEEVSQEMQTILSGYISRGAGPEVLQNINSEALKGKIAEILLNEKVFEILEKNTKFE